MANKITGANAGGPRRLRIRIRWAARIAQFWRQPEADAVRRIGLLILFSTTLSLVVGGFTYLAMIASIRYQQPTPKMALRDRDGLKLKIGDSYCIVVPDHDWTLKLGRGWYGIQGYPFSTRLVLGARSAMIPAPFPLVSRLGLALFTAVGVFSCYRAFSCYRVSGNGNERAEAHTG